MKYNWCVFGGWGIEPDILKPIFGDYSTYIDINLLMPHIVEDDNLLNNWTEILCNKILSSVKSTKFIAGWSTGALIAMKCANIFKPEALVLISATPSFCRNSIFNYGVKPIVLKKMVEKLEESPIEVIKEFRKQCGLNDLEENKLSWSKEELICGLIFLEKFIIFEEELYCTPLFIHGINDKIVPISAGEFLYNKYKGNFLTLDAPHACFINNKEKIIKAIEKHLKGLQI